MSRRVWDISREGDEMMDVGSLFKVFFTDEKDTDLNIRTYIYNCKFRQKLIFSHSIAPVRLQIARD